MKDWNETGKGVWGGGEEKDEKEKQKQREIKRIKSLFSNFVLHTYFWREIKLFESVHEWLNRINRNLSPVFADFSLTFAVVSIFSVKTYLLITGVPNADLI